MVVVDFDSTSFQEALETRHKIVKSEAIEKHLDASNSFDVEHVSKFKLILEN